ncbi:hypothetical protein [Sphingomonas crocodyli]|uniref:hypothetical protein n=1 Tax=Sphingomonas crocodyli TaxID=1979270 RepID=UPI0019CFFF39|nr:hypothetical protein [Sphingomonas crocodyli]
MQASGARDAKVHPDGVQEPHQRASAGESGGGAYPNPHKDKKPKTSPGDFLGHGGQTEINYHGSGQLGDQQVDEQNGARAATAKDAD